MVHKRELNHYYLVITSVVELSDILPQRKQWYHRHMGQTSAPACVLQVAMVER